MFLINTIFTKKKLNFLEGSVMDEAAAFKSYKGEKKKKKNLH